MSHRTAPLAAYGAAARAAGEGRGAFGAYGHYSALNRRSRRLLLTTVTLLRPMAAAA
jgi:hypothetical protein